MNSITVYFSRVYSSRYTALSHTYSPSHLLADLRHNNKDKINLNIFKSIIILLLKYTKFEDIFN